jgi:ribosomal protein S25
MDNKRIGITVLVLSLLVGFFVILLTNSLYEKSVEIGCFSNEECIPVESSLSVTHFVFGLVGIGVGMGIYLLLFKQEDVLDKLNKHKENELLNEKFSILLKGLDVFERKVLKVVKEQTGITQNTLRIRTNLSKGKISQVLIDLEKKGLVKREKKHKTYELFFREPY